MRPIGQTRPKGKSPVKDKRRIFSFNGPGKALSSVVCGFADNFLDSLFHKIPVTVLHSDHCIGSLLGDLNELLVYKKLRSVDSGKLYHIYSSRHNIFSVLL